MTCLTAIHSDSSDASSAMSVSPRKGLLKVISPEEQNTIQDISQAQNTGSDSHTDFSFIPTSLPISFEDDANITSVCDIEKYMKVNHSGPSHHQKKHRKVTPHFSHDKSIVSISDCFFITEVTDHNVLGAQNFSSRIQPEQIDDKLVEVTCFTSALLQSEKDNIKLIGT